MSFTNPSFNGHHTRISIIMPIEGMELYSSQVYITLWDARTGNSRFSFGVELLQDGWPCEPNVSSANSLILAPSKP